MTGDLQPTIGTVTRHPHLSIGKYHQHSVDALEDDIACLDFFKKLYPNDNGFKREVCGERQNDQHKLQA